MRFSIIYKRVFGLHKGCEYMIILKQLYKYYISIFYFFLRNILYIFLDRQIFSQPCSWLYLLCLTIPIL